MSYIGTQGTDKNTGDKVEKDNKRKKKAYRI